MKKIFFLFLSFVFSVVFWSSFNNVAHAANASLYLSPANGTHTVGGSFWVNVMINTDGAEVNTAGGKISFDASKLEVTSLNDGGSILNLWIQRPTFSNSAGTISFSGGTPSPFVGRANKVFTINFKTKKVGSASVNFTSGTVLANDGKGTNILTGMGNGTYTISPKVKAPKKEDIEKKETIKETIKEVIKEESRKEQREKDNEIESGYNLPIVKSSTHPDNDKWYQSNDVMFSWELPEGVTGVSLLLNQKEISNPGPISDGLFSEKEFKDVPEGISYFHIKFKDSKGWGAIAHFKVQIDFTPPEDCKIEIKQEDENDWPTVYFESSDKVSGLSGYELFLDDLNKEAIVLGSEEKMYKLLDVGVGKHTLAIKVKDVSGQEKFIKTEFSVKSIETPIIKNYSQEIKNSDEFFITGSGPKSSTIKVFVQGSNQEKIIEKETKSDGAGNWFLTIENENLVNGRYYVWVQAVNTNGIESEPTFKASFLITPPVFAKIGSFVVNYFTVLVSLIFMIILIIVLLTLFIEFLRKRLKKETFEIEDVLNDNLKNFKKEIEKEFIALGKMNKTEYIKEKTKMKNRLLNRVDSLGKAVDKEVKDVEKILK